VLEHSGAGKFFIDWAAAAVGRSRGGSGAGRTVTVAGYLLGAVSGSGVANTVMLGGRGVADDAARGLPARTLAGAILARRESAPSWRRRQWAPPPSSSPST
jgi:TRAP-type uncharacterized transport system fused permease subunit